MSDIENKLDKQWEKIAQSWVHAFITATKTARLYGRNHPALEESLQKILECSSPIWDTYGTVKFEIRAELLRVLNITTNQFNKPQDNPFFPLLLDQIGGLQITAGMTKDELSSFFEILYTPLKDFEENSVGTLLWEANLPHIELVRLPELLTTGGSEGDDSNAVIDDLIAAALRESIDPDAPVASWRTTVRLDSLSADQAAELRDLEKPTDITSQFKSLDYRNKVKERVKTSLTQPKPGNDPAFAQAVVASVAENATVSDILAAREALLVLGIESLKTSTPPQAMQYFDQSSNLLSRLSSETEPTLPDELTVSLGDAFAAALLKTEGHHAELQTLWLKLPDKSQETCIRTLANQKFPEPIKTLRAIAKTCKPETRQLLLYSTYETTPEVAGHMLLFTAALLGSDANQALAHALQHNNGQVRIVAFRMLARTTPAQAVAMARKLLIDGEPALRKDARLLLKQTKDPTVIEQIPKLFKTTHFKAWDEREKFDFFIWSLQVLGKKGPSFIGNIALSAGMLAGQYERDLALLAVEALRVLGGPDEIIYLERARKTLTIHPSVKKAAKEALAGLTTVHGASK